MDFLHMDRMESLNKSSGINSITYNIQKEYQKGDKQKG